MAQAPDALPDRWIAVIQPSGHADTPVTRGRTAGAARATTLDMRKERRLLATLLTGVTFLFLSAAPAYADPPGNHGAVTIVAGAQRLPSTSTVADGAPLALLGLGLIGAGGALLRRRNTTL
jgi:LPXTG-motif cell wall-anchored protein